MATAEPMRADSLKRKITTKLPTPSANRDEGRSFAPPAEAPSAKVIRHEEFARRFAIACDGMVLCPPKHRGRLAWLAEQMERAGHPISEETARKWTAGESKPKPDKMKLLAVILETDEAWLSLGISPELAPRELKARNSMAAGSVNLVAGLIQMNGGHPAFPEANDRRALDAHVDLYAIIKGAQYAFHVVLGAKVEPDVYKFTIPINYADAFQMGVVQVSATSVILFEIPAEMAEGGTRRHAGIEVTMRMEEIKLRAIEDFSTRI